MAYAQLNEQQLKQVESYTTPAAAISDEVIIAQILEGHSDAYAQLMRRYNPRMFRVARSIVQNDDAAMDIVQDAHIKAFYKIAKFNGSSSFLAWLYAITRNEALMYLRKQKSEKVTPLFDSDYKEPEATTSTALQQDSKVNAPETVLENKQLKQLINNNIDSLPAEFRLVFVLRAIEQLSVKETAEILEIKEATVKTRYFRAKNLIRVKIQAYLDQMGMNVYEFGGEHCNRVIFKVMSVIQQSR